MVFKRKHGELYGDGKTWFRGPIIGRGSGGGVVHTATLKKPKFRPSHLPATMAVKSAEVSDSALLRKEATVLDDVQGSPYVCRFFGEEVTTGENNKRVYNLLLEHGTRGTLADVIKESGGRGLPESDVRRYARGLLEGLNHVHGLGYVHCGLKPENIIIVPVNTSSGVECVAKISGFGFAKREKQENNLRGNIRFFSPDIWALGCIVVEMLTGKPLRDEKNYSEIEEFLFGIGEGNEATKLDSELSKERMDFLFEACFARNPLPARMLLKHPFVAEDRREDEEEDEESVGDTGDIFFPGSSSCYEAGDEHSSSAFPDDWKLRVKKPKVDAGERICLSLSLDHLKGCYCFSKG